MIRLIAAMVACVFALIVILTLKHGKIEDRENKPPKLACIYAYYEKNDEYKENFLYFLKNGILDHVDYYFVMNGDYSVSLPNRSNVHIIERPNIGYDFGAGRMHLPK